MFFIVVCVLFAVGVFPRENIEASTYTNAYEFYSAYGKKMKLVPISDNDGNIYYATRGKSSTAAVKYTNIGWKVSVTNQSGSVLQIIYYVLDGEHMVKADKRTVDGYLYTLYKVPLSNLKSRMSKKTIQALSQANCNILFDACMIVKIDGEAQGGMDDNGLCWGDVYMTYEEIAEAENWTQASKDTLKTYYNKEVEGLFYNVEVKKTEGIKSVSGAGKYCYGMTATISAEPEDGYAFDRWGGDSTSTNAEITYTIGMKNAAFIAYAKVGYVTVNYFTGFEMNGKPTKCVEYVYNLSGQSLSDFGWKMDGYHQIGWSKKSNSDTADYALNAGITTSWLEKNYPEINLYAVWKPNTYTIVFDPDGGTGSIENLQVQYADRIGLPTEGFKKKGHNLSGWGFIKDTQDYQLGEEIEAAVLVNAANCQMYNNSTIILYAVWGDAPEIIGNSIYVSLEDAGNGVITEQWLAQYVNAQDKEDGSIPYGQGNTNSFVIINYAETDFTEFQKPGYVTESFCATDSHGNVTVKNIPVYIVDTGVYDEDFVWGSLRFISKKYYKDENGSFLDEENGGLATMSIWRCEESYTSILDRLFLP